LGSNSSAEAVWAEETYDRASGCPDPLFPPGPHSLRSEAPGGERDALASAGRALMGLHGFPEDQVRNVALYWFGAPGKPFRRRSGIPFHTLDQEPSLLTSPLSTSRAPSGHVAGGPTPIHKDRLHPPRLPAPSAHAASRIRSTRACHTRHLPSSAFRTLSTAYTPRRLPSLFHPGSAHGVLVFRALLLPGGLDLSRGRVLSCRSDPNFGRR